MSNGQTRYMAPPYDARVASEQEALLLNSHDDQLIRLPLSSVRILGLCDRFRNLDEQTHHIAGQMKLSPTQIPAVRQTLDRLAQRKLLQTEHDIYRQLTAQASDNPSDSGIETLFVRTCGRPETLERLLESIHALGQTGPLKRCLVLDDDTQKSTCKRTAALVERYRDRLPIELQHISRARRRELLQAIAETSHTSSDDLVWFIEGDPDDSQPSYGASLNLALLLGAGTRIALIDDDAALAAFRLNSGADHIRFCPHHDADLVFPEPDQALEPQFEPVNDHPVELHAGFLGLDGSALARAQEHDLTGLFSELDPQVLFKLSKGSRVRITSNGTLGDPGTSGIQWLLTESRQNLEPLFASEERYRALLGQRRLARSPGGVQAAITINLMTTTLTGVDNRELLLPTQARGGNEDLFFGALVAYLHPGSLHVALPHMLLHMRPEPRQWDSTAFKRARTTNQGRFLADQIERLSEQASGDSMQGRLHILRGWLENLASMEQADLRWRLNQDLLQLRADTIESLARTRRELNPPPWMAADFDRALDAHASVSDEAREKINHLAQRLPGFARRYAAGLSSWESAWQYCRETGTDELLALLTQTAES